MIYNPSKEERYLILKNILKDLNREEDFSSLIELASPSVDIETIASKADCKGVRVGIIGGGCSGLTAAYELRKLGIDVTILEAEEERIGGRINTYYYDDDLYGELGAMEVPVSHETLWHYIKIFNLDTNSLLNETENNIIFVKNVHIQGEDVEEEIRRFIYPKFPLTDTEKNQTLKELQDYVYNNQLLSFSKEMRKQLLKILKSYPNYINALDHISVIQACELLGLSRGTIDLLNIFSGLDRGLFFNSYLELLRQVYPLNFLTGFQISRGMVNLPLAFYNSIITPSPNLGNVRFNQGCRVSGISYDNKNNSISLKYQKRKTNETIIEDFDYVISAIPFSALRVIELCPLLSNEKMFAIRELHYTASQKTILLCNERFWERKINNETIEGGSSITDLPITTVWYPSINYNNDYGVIIGSYNIELDAVRVGNLDDKTRFEVIKRQLEQVHRLPINYLDKVIIDFKTVQWNREPNFLGAFCLNTPEQNRLFSYPATTPEYNNRLFFAGEHTSVYHGWIQGALQSGMRAANEIANMCRNNKCL